MELKGRLIESADKVRANAYAPFSGYHVGAAVLDVDGNIWVGTNLETVSFGLTICAERSAIARMVSEGIREIKAVVVVTEDGGAPCGMCLQTILEFTHDPMTVQVVCVSASGEETSYLLGELLPHGFKSSSLKRT